MYLTNIQTVHTSHDKVLRYNRSFYTVNKKEKKRKNENDKLILQDVPKFGRKSYVLLIFPLFCKRKPFFSFLRIVSNFHLKQFCFIAEVWHSPGISKMLWNEGTKYYCVVQTRLWWWLKFHLRRNVNSKETAVSSVCTKLRCRFR